MVVGRQQVGHFEKLLDQLSHQLGIVGGVHKLYTPGGQRLENVAQIRKSGVTVVIACGTKDRFDPGNLPVGVRFNRLDIPLSPRVLPPISRENSMLQESSSGAPEETPQEADDSAAAPTELGVETSKDALALPRLEGHDQKSVGGDVAAAHAATVHSPRRGSVGASSADQSAARHHHAGAASPPTVLQDSPKNQQGALPPNARRRSSSPHVHQVPSARASAPSKRGTDAARAGPSEAILDTFPDTPVVPAFYVAHGKELDGAPLSNAAKPELTEAERTAKSKAQAMVALTGIAKVQAKTAPATSAVPLDVPPIAKRSTALSPKTSPKLSPKASTKTSPKAGPNTAIRQVADTAAKATANGISPHVDSSPIVSVGVSSADGKFVAPPPSNIVIKDSNVRLAAAAADPSTRGAHVHGDASSGARISEALPAIDPMSHPLPPTLRKEISTAASSARTITASARRDTSNSEDFSGEDLWLGDEVLFSDRMAGIPLDASFSSFADSMHSEGSNELGEDIGDHRDVGELRKTLDRLVRHVQALERRLCVHEPGLRPRYPRTNRDGYLANGHWIDTWAPLAFVPTKEDGTAPEHTLRLEHVFGCPQQPHALVVLRGGSVVYPMAQVVVIHHIDRRNQRCYAEHTARVSCIAISEDEKHVASGQVTNRRYRNNKAEVRVWNPQTLETVAEFKLGSRLMGLAAMTFLPQAQKLLLTMDKGADPRLRLWNWRTGSQLAESNACSFLATRLLYLDGAVCIHSESRISLWDVDPLAKKPEITKRGEVAMSHLAAQVSSLGWTTPGKQLLSGDSAGNLLQYDVVDGSGGSWRTVLAGAHKVDSC